MSRWKFCRCRSGRVIGVAGLKFSELVATLGFLDSEVAVGSDPVVLGVSADSRSVSAGDLFVCMPSASRDTHSYLIDVVKQGAVAAVVHSSSALRYALGLGLAAVWVEPRGSRFNFAVGRICREVLGDPTSKMRVIGVTGTNGKTTTAWILRQALVRLGRNAAYLGTLGYLDADGLRSGENTTPFPVELWSLLSEAAEKGVTDFVLEASSHALQERRLAGVNFDTGVFLNLTQDHLDFHGSMDHYAAAKKLLFTEWASASSKSFVGILNQEDCVGSEWLRELPCRSLSFGGIDADLLVAAQSVGVDRLSIEFRLGDEGRLAEIPLGGAFNVENSGACVATLLGLEYSLEEACWAMQEIKPSPGRFEPVLGGKGVSVLVDYAHTPDALEQLLETVRELCEGRLICVFGCGGDRDRSKRPKMGAAASKLADVVFVTSDNPRTEDAQGIVNDILVGMSGDYMVELDRKTAIFAAIGSAEVGDVVVIAGKGHEDYQIIGRKKEWFDDRVVASEALAGR